jgi:hypothetical protein
MARPLLFDFSLVDVFCMPIRRQILTFGRCSASGTLCTEKHKCMFPEAY